MALKSTCPSPRERKRPARFYPVLVAPVHALPARGVKLGILDVEGPNPLVVEVDVLQVVKALKHEVGGVVEQAGARVVLHFVEEHLVADAVVQVLAGVNFVAHIHPALVEGLQNGQPAAGQLVEARLDQAGGALGPGVDHGP